MNWSKIISFDISAKNGYMGIPGSTGYLLHLNVDIYQILNLLIIYFKGEQWILESKSYSI